MTDARRCAASVAFVWLVCVAPCHGAQEPTDADLVAASAGRTVRVRTAGEGRSRVVDVALELYVARVLAGEGEPRAADAAQEALAIAIRTFALANAGRHRRDGFDLCDTTHCQVLRASTPASRRAARATAGEWLLYDGRPAEVFYSASCGGRSEAASQVWPGAIDHPYLASVEDEVHGSDPSWVIEVPAARIDQALRRAGFAGRRLKNLEVERRSASGRVTRLHVAGMRPDTIAGEDFRAAIGARALRSTAFTVKKVVRVFRFTGRGYGHGVGLCVIGAGRRAARGETAPRILAQYFPGLELNRGMPVVGDARPAAPERSAVPPPSAAEEGDVERIARRARDELSAALGIAAPPPVRVEVHQSLDAFRQSTGRPWWVATSVAGTTLDVAPLPVLVQGDGVEASIRRGVAEALMTSTLADRPAWVRVGGARYFASTRRASAVDHVTCPTDAELMMAVSAAAQRDADLRAEACFAAAVANAGDWRRVRRIK